MKVKSVASSRARELLHYSLWRYERWFSNQQSRSRRFTEEDRRRAEVSLFYDNKSERPILGYYDFYPVRTMGRECPGFSLGLPPLFFFLNMRPGFLGYFWRQHVRVSVERRLTMILQVFFEVNTRAKLSPGNTGSLLTFISDIIHGQFNALRHFSYFTYIPRGD